MIIFETIICAETEIALNLSCTITTTNIRKPLVIEGVFYVQVLFHDQALDLVGEPLQDGDQLPKFKVFTTHDEKIKTKDLLGKLCLDDQILFATRAPTMKFLTSTEHLNVCVCNSQ